MECLLKKNGLDLHMNYCSAVISERQVRRLSQQFEHVLGQICHLTEIIHRQRTTLESLRQPTTETERQMQQIWAQVLNHNQASIGIDYNFFHLGDDSIAAMQVVTEALKLGLRLAVSDIFRRPKLQDVAKKACESGWHFYGEEQLRNDSEVQVNGDTEQTKLSDDTNLEQSKSHWRRLLNGSSMTNLKPHGSYALAFGEGPCVTRHVPKTITQGTGFTFSTVLKAAWAYVLAKHLANDDVVFCSLTHGRGLLHAERLPRTGEFEHRPIGQIFVILIFSFSLQHILL